MKMILMWIFALSALRGLAVDYDGRFQYDRFKWTSGACRHEDFQFMSSRRGCRWTKSFHEADEIRTSHLASCNGDEFTCPTLLAPFRCVPRYYLNTVMGCYFNNTMRTMVPCRKSEFTCEKTRRCVPRWTVADNLTDCSDIRIDDNSDETRGPYHKCTIDEFRCQFTGRCIPREWVLDGQEDCLKQSKDSKSSDEITALETCHEDTEFRCAGTGRCLLRYRVMDGHNDCEDNSDETQTLPRCNKVEFRCHDTGRCIPRSWVQDSRSNCPDGSDEIPQLNVTCIENEFSCRDGKRCIPEMYRCDGMQHCADCSDEIEGCETPRMWRCPGDPSTCFAQSFACDPFLQCPNHTDTMSFLPGFKCDSIKTEDIEITCAVPQWMLADDISVCADQSDLCVQNGNFTCSYCGDGNTIISKAQICDSVVDCRDLWDECLCGKNGQRNGPEALCKNVCYGNGGLACENCRSGEIYCDNKCINQKQLCDGKLHCPFSELDEKFCTKPGERLKRGKNQRTYQCQDLNAFILRLGKNFAVPEKFLPKMATRCDGVFECILFDDECSDDCRMKPYACDDIPEHSIPIPFIGDTRFRTCKDFDFDNIVDNFGFLGGMMICNGIKDCKGGEDERNCTKRHECNAGKVQWLAGERQVVSIDKRRVCDSIIDCIDDDASDERNCSSETHFYCYNGKPLFVPAKLVLDGKQDCEDNSDECPASSFDDNAFSSREEMIRTPFLRYFIWVMAGLAILGNAGVFIETLLLDGRKKLTSVGKCNRVLIMNLAASDFFMGIALLMIGIKSSLLSGNYCLQDDVWRTSSQCNAIGVFIVMSSETSVFSLVFLTFYRLYAVYKPFTSRHMKVRKVYVSVAISWFVSFLLAAIPVFPATRNSVVTNVLIKPSTYFPSTRVSWEEMQNFAMRVIVLGNITELNPNYIGGWEMMGRLQELSQVKDYVPQILGDFGYYSTDGVCIPRFFRRKDSPPLHPLSIIIAIVNFCSLLFIIISYIMIYRASSAKRPTIKGKEEVHEKQNQAMQRKITILIGTDLCCWLPICIMSFVSQAGIPLSRDVYAVAAIVLLPINSSLNPFIYSNWLESARGYFKNKIMTNASNPTAPTSPVERIPRGTIDATAL